MNDARRKFVIVVGLSLASAAVYAPTLRAGWVWDDVDVVQPSPALRDFAGLRRAVTTDLYRQADPRLEASSFWRPLALASYWLDTRLGAAPRALHVGNALLHALAVALLALVLLRRIEGAAGLAASALATAWWAFHPEHVEAVAWISCRPDLLCAVVVLALLAVPWRPGVGRAALHGLLFLAGLLSKDGFAVVMAALVVADDWAERRAPTAAGIRWIAVAVAVGAWWGMRSALGLPTVSLVRLGSLPRLLLEAVGIYTARAIAPLPLTVGHPYVPSPLWVATGIVVLTGLGMAVARCRRLAVPVALFVAGLFPVAVAIAMFDEVPERYFHVPSIGLALLLGELVASCIASSRRVVRIAAPVAVALLAVLGLVSVASRLPDWREDHALFAAALRVDPDDAVGNLQLGIHAARIGQWGEARQSLEVAQHSDPRSGRIATALAWVLLQSNHPGDALKQAERATAVAPDHPDGWYYLAYARHITGDHAGEVVALGRILQLSPEYPSVRDARVMATCELSGRADCGDAAPPQVAPR